MALVMDVGQFLIENLGALLAALLALLGAVILLLKAYIKLMDLIPGNQGELIAQKIVDALHRAVDVGHKIIDFIGGPNHAQTEKVEEPKAE